MENTFNIIAVRVLKNCSPSIRKILKEETTYFFRNEYVYDENKDWVSANKCKRSVPNNFFNDSGSNLCINISAIVGKNGDGKSSLVELVFRILNNFACLLFKSQHREELVTVEGVFAELFYEIDNYTFCITCEDKLLSLRKNEVEIFNSENIALDSAWEKYSYSLFYTLVSNYSLYSYNSKDFKCESNQKGKCWIDGIFHKHDGYQTPIVLSPFRKDGNIDVNIESVLSKQRLLVMFVDGSIKQISNNVHLKGFTCSIKNGMKLKDEILQKYMYEQEHLLKSVFEGYCRSFIRIPKTKYKKIFNDTMFFWNIISECMEIYPSLFNVAFEIIQKSQDKEFIEALFYQYNINTDMSKYISLIKRNRKLYGLVKNEITKFEENNYYYLNFSIIHVVLLINEICKLWNVKFNELGIDNISDRDLFDENSVINKAKAYIIYKTIYILRTYILQFGNVLDTLNRGMFFLNGHDNYIFCKKMLSNAFELLYDDTVNNKSHITLKIRQTLNFIKFNQNFDFLKISRKDNCVNFDKYKFNLDRLMSADKNLKPIDLLPPPIFDIDIQILKGNQQVSFSSLSSGEHQLLYSISHVAYHLRNIDSMMKTDSTINYRFVNLIFEEIELYFHPEYQQLFIKRLLDVILQMKFDNIKGVNMCFVTHSPFVLSDIPKNNVLFLEDGKPSCPMQEDTFGANIHTLLHNGFFLSNVPIGAFAQKKINLLFEKLHNGETEGNVYNEIMLVSEPILKSQLLKLYKQNKIDTSKEIDELKKEINELRVLLNKINKSIN